MKQALRCGIGVAEFWEMTLRETLMAIDAAIWDERRRQKQNLSVAWHMAAMSRAKRLPSLKRVLSSTETTVKARPLKGAELRKRRKEYRELTAEVDVGLLAGRLRKRASTGSDGE